MRTMSIVLATHNQGKVAEIRRMLGERLSGRGAARCKLVSAADLGLPDPVEDGMTFEENALLKARFVARRTGLPCIADDSGLVVDVMGAAPGVLSARWAGVHGDDAANRRLLLAQLEDIPDGKRMARFECRAALVVPRGYDGAKPVEIVRSGKMTGRIVRAPRGTNGFGYDSVFVPDEQPGLPAAGDARPLTCAELTAEQKNAVSHRGKAMRALLEDIQARLF